MDNNEKVVSSLDDVALATPQVTAPQQKQQKGPRYCASLADIKYPEKWENITFDAYVADFISAGNDANRVPLKFKARFVDTGEYVEIISWEYNLVQSIKEGKQNNTVFHMVCDAGYFNRNTNSVRLTTLTPTTQTVTVQEPDVKTVPIDIKSKIDNIIDKYIVDNDYRKLLKRLLGQKFYKWPAATSVHHAFEGGLALHTYTVTYIALQLLKVYGDRVNIDKDLMLTGALLHDIGKLEEYDELGNVTLNGVMMSHIVYGIQMINTICVENNIDPYSPKITKQVKKYF